MGCFFPSKSERLEVAKRNLDQEALRVRYEASRVEPQIQTSRLKAKEFASRNEMKRASEYAQDVVEKTKYKASLEEQARNFDRTARDINLKKSHLATHKSIKKVNNVLNSVAKMGVGDQDEIQKYVANSSMIKGSADNVAEAMSFDPELVKEETAAEVNKLLAELQAESAVEARRQQQAINMSMPQFEVDQQSEREVQQ